MPLQKSNSENEKTIEKITRILQKRSEKSLETAKNIVLSEQTKCKELKQAFKYYAKSWYDYIHPGLISIGCEAVNGDPDDSIPVQTTLLLLTAAIDLHDDIIDGSETKYGKATLFGKFGKSVALLVGDAFMIEAFLQLHKLEDQFPKRKMDAVWNEIKEQFFTLGDAEALETSSKGSIDISPEEYMCILEKKASSFEIHTRIGAIVGDGEQDEINVLGNYGRTLGILSAVRDDFIDIFEPDELQNRIKNELPPLPMLYAFKNSKTKKTLMGILSKPKISEKDAQEIVDIIYQEREVEKLKAKIQEVAMKTLKNISTIPNKDINPTIEILITGLIEDL